MESKGWTVGDPCPGCNGALTAQRRPTAAEWRRFTDREVPYTLPAGVDAASDEQHAELGDLHRCGRCGYQARVKPEAGGDAPTATAEGAAPTSSRASTAKKRATAAAARE